MALPVIGQLADMANGDALLMHRGRFIDTTFLLGVGDQEWLLRIAEGRVVRVAEGPFVMPRFTFALRAAAADWAAFWSPEPAPGYHDLFALIRFGRLSVTGDMHDFMANLFYFKALLAKLRVDRMEVTP